METLNEYTRHPFLSALIIAILVTLIVRAAIRFYKKPEDSFSRDFGYLQRERRYQREHLTMIAIVVGLAMIGALTVICGGIVLIKWIIE